MANLLFKLIPTAECNEEYTPDKQLQEGVECDGALVVMFEDGKPSVSIMHGTTVAQISDFLQMDASVALMVRQACAIAEGYKKADELHKIEKMEEMKKSLAKHIKSMIVEEDAGFDMM